MARHALFQMYSVYDKAEVMRILFGNRKPEIVRAEAPWVIEALLQVALTEP